jgi:hypothetical protein
MKKDGERRAFSVRLLFSAARSAVRVHVHIRAVLIDITGRMATNHGTEQDQSEQSTDHFHAVLLC